MLPTSDTKIFVQSYKILKNIGKVQSQRFVNEAKSLLTLDSNVNRTLRKLQIARALNSANSGDGKGVELLIKCKVCLQTNLNGSIEWADREPSGLLGVGFRRI